MTRSHGITPVSTADRPNCAPTLTCRTRADRVTDSMRVAAIDCGTNSIRLLVADVVHEPDGAPQLVDVHREMRVVRLGEGVDATGRLSSDALDRTWRALADYAAVITASGVVRVRMVATSATRDAAEPGGLRRDGAVHPRPGPRGDHR